MLSLLAKREALRANHRNKQDVSSYLGKLATPSVRQYTDQLNLWETFKSEICEPDAVPNLENLQLFAWLCASRSEGRMDVHADVKTLCFNISRFRSVYNECNDYHISKQDIDEVKKYIRTDLADELDLQDQEKDKEYTDWEDVKIILYFLIVEDPYVYNDNRFRAQIVLLYLLVAESGERIGAIVRSDCYCKGERSVCYEDIRLFLRPLSSSDGRAQFKLQITYNNRKGERGIRDNLVQTYYQRADLAHCVVVWFLAVAFLDNAFDGQISSPADLLNMRNLGPGEREIRFKKDKGKIPIFRRMQSTGSTTLSPDLPWGTNSATNASQRVVRDAGFPQRYTFYNIRRTMGNMLEDSHVPAARRKKLMGHSGESDTVFRKHYESRHMVVDTGNIFRKEAPRPEKTEVLSMHLRRDPNVPQVPDLLLSQSLDNDEKIETLLRARYDLQAQLREIDGDLEQGYNKTTIHAALEGLRRALKNRRRFVTDHTKRDFRKKYFENPEFILSQYPLARPPERHYRSELASSLYPEDSEGSALAAIEAIISHCNSKDARQTQRSRKQQPAEDDERLIISPSSQGTETSAKKPLTAVQVQRLVHLRMYEKRCWQEILPQFPGWTQKALRSHYWKSGTSVKPDDQVVVESEPDQASHFQQQVSRKRPHSSSFVSDTADTAGQKKKPCDASRRPVANSVVKEKPSM